jgi:uncharacterized protein with beta-barrel porin domain
MFFQNHKFSLLISTSCVALLMGAGAPAWSQCATSITGSVSGCTNSTTITGINIHSATVSGSIVSTGTISPNGISVDGSSSITATPALSSGAAIWIKGPTFGGGISNAGTITAATGAGINISHVSTFSGGVSNSGTISASNGDGLIIFSTGTFSGGISNSGTISGGFEGISLSASTFSGGITNSGSISGVNGGIIARNISSFGGGINNSGTISSPTRTGISLTNIGTFSGAITNAGGGTISAAVGIRVSSISTFGSSSTAGGITNAGTISAQSVGITIQNGTTTFLGGITNSGKISAGATGITVSSVSSFSGGISNSGKISGGNFGIFLASDISFGTSSLAGGITNSGTISAGTDAVLIIGVTTFSGGISNSGTITAPSVGVFVVNVSHFSGGITNSGTISAAIDGIAIENTAAAGYGLSFSGNISNSGTISAAKGIIIGPGVTFAPGSAIVNSGTIIGSTAAIDVSQATSPVTIDQVGGLISGAIKLSANADVLNISGGVVNGSIIGAGTSDTVNFALGSGTYGGNTAYAITGINALNINSGTIILDAVANSATNVTITGGALQVGDAANTGAVLTSNTVNVTGGTLSGHGTVAGNVTIGNGGTLMPGGSIGTLTINGNLVMSSGSFYATELSPTQHSQTNVIGTATLNGGTVVLTPQLGTYNAAKIAILTTSGSLTGTFSPTIAFSNSVNVNGAALSYDAHDVFLSTATNLQPVVVTLMQPANASSNARNIIGGINDFILGGNNLPSGFQNLGNLSGNALNHAANQLAGQSQGSFAPNGFTAGDMFLNLVLNPYIEGRSGFANSSPPLAYAAEPPTAPAASAFSALALGPRSSFEPNLSLWAAGYGGSGTVSGNAATGAANTTSQIYGYATGVDYRVSPNTIVGLALGGGGTTWQLGQGMGTGRSDMFQAGIYGTTHFGPAYVSAAASYSLQEVSTTRDVTLAGFDTLQGNFSANVLSTRLESGYRLPYGVLAVTPYGAVQTQAMFLPSYGEYSTSGSSQFALQYPSRTFNATRTEIGTWFDSDAWADKGVKLYSRVAWSHDFDNEGTSIAFFQSLPGTSFIVNSAKPARDGALVTAGFEYKLADGWSLLGKFDGEFSSTTAIFAGTGTIRKVW